MFAQIAFFKILGQPVVIYLGIVALLLFLFAALIAMMNMKGNYKISPKWHPIIARIAIIIALVHGLLIFLALLKI
jgi:uncharacterized integral membrane protein